MASHSSSQAEKIEQIIGEFFAKSLHIILESRIPFVCSAGEHSGASSSSSSSSSGLKARDKWFNLALGECPAALEKMELWKRSMPEPMVVDVILLRTSDHGVDVPVGKRGFTRNEFEGLNAQVILERWTVQYEYRKSSTKDAHLSRISSGSGTPRWEDGKKAGTKIGPGKGRSLSGTGDIQQGAGTTQSSSHVVEVPIIYKKTYKRTIILLRSLYCTARLLPAYRLFRLVTSSGHNCNFTLAYRVSSSPESLSRADKAEMLSFNFTAVDTPGGRLKLSVSYRPTTAVTALEESAPLIPEIITDYVGSPAADLPKRFHSDSTVTSGKKKVHVNSPPLSVPGTSTCTGFVRRHSWSGNIHKMLPSSVSPYSPSYRLSLSPSPSYSDTHGSPYIPASLPAAPHHYLRADHSPSPMSSPLHSLSGQRSASFDEYWLSPPFSPSPSPSPPTHLTEDNLSGRFRHSGSAPVSIPVPSVSGSLRSSAADCYNQSKTLLPPPSPKSQKSDALCRTASANLRIMSAQSPGYQGYPSEWRNSNKGDLSRPMELQTRRTELHSSTGQKVYKDGNDDIGEVPGVKFSSSCSPRFSFSRSFNRLSYQDEIEYEGFSCPFAVDDDEIAESRSRTDSLDGRASVSESSEIVGQALATPKKSQDAAVGALVHMLKSAPPLYPDFGNISVFSHSTAQVQNSTDGCGATDLSGSLHFGREVSQMFGHKTTADALEELRSYREMKDNLLSQSGTQAAGSRSL
uniref:TSA: Wollemia nobilis Ref_Wollemi_Transcript_29149_3647 transcribed RNA sequence n=1 Tax=Wollemia nobilis TaxID=56998 RepID=A0A0C9S0R1_9CONI